MDLAFKELQSALDGVLHRFEGELRGVRSNRPSVQLIEDITLELYGQIMTIKQLGSLSVRPPRDIEVHVWDKGALAAVTKAIQEAKTGLSVSEQGTVVRVSLPPLTEERRTELTKLVKKMTEAARIQVRNHRDDEIKKLKAEEDEKQINKDQAFKAKESIQGVVDKVNKKIEVAFEAKLKELQG